MVKSFTLENFFKKRGLESLETNTSSPTAVDLSKENHPSKHPRTEITEVNLRDLKRDPAERDQIYDYPVDRRDEIRRAYLSFGPQQPYREVYPLTGNDAHPRRFQYSWFKKFPWLEWSESQNKAFCHPCFIFNTKTHDRFKTNAFTIQGFQNWKKVHCGEKCSFLQHVGKDPNSTHNLAVQACRDLQRTTQHIGNIFQKQTSEQIAKNRLRVQSSIDVVRWLTFQACAFRGHDEGPNSKNRGNFLEMLKFLASYNEKVAEVVLENAPGNATYTSPKIQKEILEILSTKVRNAIREEIGDAKFCIIVDEARDESKKEQMAIVLRFVDKQGFVRERFFDIVHVPDTMAITLHNKISGVLSHNNLNIQDIRGQGYDGASNMRGEWNGLQALFIKECPYAYYIHCFAHRLQLALVGAAKEVIPVYQFFSKLTSIINVVGASCKRHDELLDAQARNIEELLLNGDLESGRGLNQVGTLQRHVDTQWSSHFSSICSLMKMFDATCQVLTRIIEDGCTYSQRGDADAAYNALTSFEFIFIMHLMQEIMGITNCLCLVLQSKSQDILNALEFVRTTKRLIQELRDGGWVTLLKKVTLFCNEHGVDIPDMRDNYAIGRARLREKQERLTIEHHFRFDVFHAVIDCQRQELDSRFNEHTIELFVLCSALDPKDGYKFFKIEDICCLVEKFYPQDFTDQEKIHLKFQLQHYGMIVPQDDELKSISTLSELCQVLERTGKSKIFPLVDRLVRLVLTLPVSTATTERAFSSMKLVKSRLRNRMGDEYLADSMIVYIEREIAEKFNLESLIYDFDQKKERRLPLKE